MKIGWRLLHKRRHVENAKLLAGNDHVFEIFASEDMDNISLGVFFGVSLSTMYKKYHRTYRIALFCRNLDFSSSLKRSNTFPRNTTPPLVPRLHEYHGQDYNENTLNEDSLFSEIHRASTVRG
jgi:hypothetical protein